MVFLRSARAGLGARPMTLCAPLRHLSVSSVSRDENRNTHFGFRTVQESDKESLGRWMCSRSRHRVFVRCIVVRHDE